MENKMSQDEIIEFLKNSKIISRIIDYHVLGWFCYNWTVENDYKLYKIWSSHNDEKCTDGEWHVKSIYNDPEFIKYVEPELFPNLTPYPQPPSDFWDTMHANNKKYIAIINNKQYE